MCSLKLKCRQVKDIKSSKKQGQHYKAPFIYSSKTEYQSYNYFDSSNKLFDSNKRFSSMKSFSFLLNVFKIFPFIFKWNSCKLRKIILNDFLNRPACYANSQTSKSRIDSAEGK